jgi:hypothetical protein
VQSSDEGHALLERFEGRRGHTVRAGRLALHSNAFLRHKLARVAREVLRATALSSWLRTGVLEVPKSKRPLGLVLFDSTETYQRWVDDWVARGFIRREYHELVSRWTFYHASKANLVLSRPRTEASLQALMLLTHWFDLCEKAYGARVQPCLTAGHVGWLSLNFFGTAPAGYSNMSVKERRRETHTTTGREPALTREFFLRLQRAGLAGSRHWIRYLASREEDPPWSRSMVDQLADIAGDDRLKSIFVVEYLQEAGRLEELCKGTLDREQRPPVLFRATLGEPLARFETRWREWMVPALRADLATRLAGSSGRARDPNADELLDTLASIRSRAWPEAELEPIWIDPALSAGARAHASYLRLHPEQAAAWPDAHEEWPDREGFSAAGCWAAGHSVIISGVSGPRRAIDGWMGTFYHRLPLLDPGVMGVGWGIDGGFAVLDMSSLVRPAGEPMQVVWPPDGARNVPRNFHAGEIPHPVPGEDQTKWGYPITLQFFGVKDTPRCSLELWQGGTRVECHLSTPSEPTNPELAPAGAFCLIPMRTLKPQTTYRVVAKTPSRTWDWSFATGGA